MTTTKSRVLVIDDDPDIVEVIQLLLEDAGYLVSNINQLPENANLAQICLQAQPDFIILDMLLSGQDGRHLARHLKENQSTNHIPLMMISAHPQARSQALAAGADDFLAKPFDMDEMLAKVEHYC
ncbi:response regulator [Ktedonobacter robiniae]|uniref:Response regulatory domain-containing protein n=1 Tax=Ktedonobacter robiniae TaxID=2778365 RepID=A0ABQ3V1N2_9CHLR|nr:response regulator transcription factor [Ktedonobacter robiniae]GHO59054.1 hypothetical protein KSB_75290 [Ktedonobacter robiniae]